MSRGAKRDSSPPGPSSKHFVRKKKPLLLITGLLFFPFPFLPAIQTSLFPPNSDFFPFNLFPSRSPSPSSATNHHHS